MIKIMQSDWLSQEDEPCENKEYRKSKMCAAI